MRNPWHMLNDAKTHFPIGSEFYSPHIDHKPGPYKVTGYKVLEQKFCGLYYSVLLEYDGGMAGHNGGEIDYRYAFIV